MEDGGGGRAPNNPKDRKQQQRRNEKQRQAKSKPMSHELDGKEGSTTVKVIQDSQANVCIRASTAGASNIMRFGLRIEELGEEDGGDDKGGQPPAADVDNHLSFMEKQLQRLEYTYTIQVASSSALN